MKLLKLLATAVLAVALPCAALAQTSPNWGYRYVPTPAQWNAAFAGKQDYLGAPPLLITGGTMTGPLVTPASTTANAGFNVSPGSAPTSPNNGDIWSTSSGLYVQINGATVGPLTEGTSGSFGNTSPISLSFPSGVVTYSCPTCGVTGNPLSQFAATTSAQLAGVLTNETGTGLLVFNTSPSLVTPALGAATATSINGNTITTGTGTLALGSNTLTLGAALTVSGVTSFAGAFTQAGAFATTLTSTGVTNSTLPAGSHTLAGLDVVQTFSAANTFSSQITSSVSIGTAPFAVTSTTNVANLNASSLNGATFAAPGAIGSGTAGSGAFTSLSASGTISGSGFSTYLASPPVIGGTAPAAGTFTTLSATTYSGLPTASSSVFGIAKVDGTTIVASGGVISAVGGTATNVDAAGGTSITNGTPNGVFIDNAGKIANTAAGTIGQYLGANSSGVPVYKSGGWVLLNTLTASSSSVLSDTSSLTSTYNEYEIEIDNIICSAASQSLQIQATIGGTLQTSGYQSQIMIGNGSTVSSQSLGTGIPIANTTGCPTAQPGVSARLKLFQPSVSAQAKMFTGIFASGVGTSATSGGTINGYWPNSGVLSAIQLMPSSSGTLTSGVMKIYGRL
jgi:hypothetical protein